jgi:integrating conjugative element protein (TIGR03757 family)
MKYWGLVMAFLLNVEAHAEEIRDVVVFTTSAFAMVDVNARVTRLYRLDAPDQALAEFANGLPKEMSAAKSEVIRRLNEPEWQHRFKHIQHAFEGVSEAWMHNITKLPAIVVNDRYVIYGVVDVDRALGYVEAQ